MTCCVCQDNRFSGLASYHFGLVLRLSRLSNYWDYPDYTDRTSTIRLIRVIPRISYYLVSSPFNRLIKLYATSGLCTVKTASSSLMPVSIVFSKDHKNSRRIQYLTINVSLFKSLKELFENYNNSMIRNCIRLSKISKIYLNIYLN